MTETKPGIRQMTVCPPHGWWTKPDGTDVCIYCSVTFRDWARGFSSNTRPKKQ